jgi:hypothetical protein
VANGFGLVGRQVEGSGDGNLPSSLLKHTVFSPFSVKENGELF